jgi:hypothetical protein
MAPFIGRMDIWSLRLACPNCAAVHLLENLEVLTETTGKQRDRTFAYAAYLEKLARRN